MDIQAAPACRGWDPCIRDYGHVCDLADARVFGLKWLQEGRDSRVFNLGTGEGFSVREVVDQAGRVTNRPVPIIEGARRPGGCIKHEHFQPPNHTFSFIRLRIEPNNMNKLRKAVFPVAGFCTRFLSATKAMPKELMPIVDKPLIQYAVEEAIAAGIDTLIFVTGRHKRAIEDHFDNNPELEVALRTKGK